MNPKFHHRAVLLAISSLIPMGIGAYITSQATGRQPASRGILDGVVHKDVAIGVGILGLSLAVWQLWNQEESLLVWIAVGCFGLEAWVGWMGGALLHASLAPLVFAIFVAMAVVTSSGWNQPPILVEDQAAPALRFLAIASPALIFLQILLGAAYRHRLIGLLPHMAGAMIVSFPILALAMLILQRHPEHRNLCAAATWLISIFLAQVMLGITAFVMPLLKANPIAVIAVTASHVVVGSLTLAVNVVLAMQVQRSVFRAPGGQMAKTH